MSEFTNPLENIRVALPCAQDWNEMVGDERQRFCGACKLNVYNLSGMSRREAETLIFQSEEGRLCVRFYRRADGSVLTTDCPVGWQAVKRNVSKTATAFASLVFTAFGAIGLTNFFHKSNNTRMEHMQTVENSNVSKRESPISLMGNVSVPNNREYTLSNGGMGNLQEIQKQIKQKRKL